MNVFICYAKDLRVDLVSNGEPSDGVRFVF